MASRGYSIPAVRLNMGRDLICLQTSLGPSEVRNVLGHDPRSKAWSALAKTDPQIADMYNMIQRKSPKDRVEALQAFICSRLNGRRSPRVLGALPAISIAFEFPPGACPEDGQSGDLVLPNRGRKLLLDGLQRVTAVMDLMQEHPDPTDIDTWFSFPATLYFPSESRGRLTNRDLGQLFFDMNYKQKAISPVHALRLDQADPYLQLTNDWDEAGIIRELGGVEDAASLGAKSSALVTRKHLLKFVRGALEGRQAQDSDRWQPERPVLTDENYDEWSSELQRYLRTLHDRMGQEQFLDRSSIHLSSAGWQVLGLIFNDLSVRLEGKISPAERDQALTRLAGIDWSRYNPKWIELFGEAERDESGRLRLAKSTKWGRQTKGALVEYVRTQSGVQELLDRASQPAEPRDRELVDSH